MSDYIDALAREAYKKIGGQEWQESREIGYHLPSKPDTEYDLARELATRPALQAILASKTGYTPSRWMLNNELDEIRLRRSAPDVDMDTIERADDPYVSAARSGLMGLSLSGGGIRSATFNLGILQGLAELKLLRCFDYLSSVSGGGYIHQWLAAWGKRENFDQVTEKLIPLPDTGCPQTHPAPVQWLRRFSNYLTPELGILSGDTWVMLATWFRNTILNQAILITALLAATLPLVLIPRLPSQLLVNAGPYAAIAIGLLFALALAATGFTGLNLRRDDFRATGSAGVFGQGGVQMTVIVPLLLGSLILAMLLPLITEDLFSVHLVLSFVLGALLLFGLTVTVTFAGGAHMCYLRSQPGMEKFRSFTELWRQKPPCRARVKAVFAMARLLAADVVASMCGAAWIAGNEYWMALLWRPAGEYWLRLILVIAPPLTLFGAFLALFVLTGLLGRSYFDSRREWLARLAGWATFYSFAWVILLGTTLFSQPLLTWLVAHVKTMSAAILTWAGTTLGGALAANGSRTSGASDNKAPSRARYLELLSVVAPYIFILGLQILISILAQVMVMALSGWEIPAAIVITFAISLLLAWRVDINEFSMHAFYRNRLARCYLGASNAERDPNPFTGFDEKDAQLALSELTPKHQYTGPFPIFCATLNLTFGEDLAWQERKGASFAFTPLYSGYDVPFTAAKSRRTGLRFNGFVKTGSYAYPRPGIHLSTASAISGAAISPDQGYHTNPATAFLLTMFNVRLGWWLANPRVLTEDGTLMAKSKDGLSSSDSGVPRSRFPAPSPRLSLFYLANELLGQANDTRRYVYLSDGGHFDNMGLYELVRRRCRYIAIMDAEEDEQLKFEGIGMAIRKCRIDFGAEISIDLRPLQHVDDCGNSSAHCVAGTIRYPDDEPGCKPGVVVYIKSSLTGDEPADILNYKRENPAFPNTSTTNQWFTESQFESYRRLGHHVAVSAFSPADPEALSCTDRKKRAEYFSDLRRIWTADTPEMKQFSAQHSALYEKLLEQLRTDSKLTGLFDMMFDRDPARKGEWKKGRSESDGDYAVRFSLTLIEFIFTVYSQLRLTYPESRRHPFAEGWLKIFRTWMRIDVIREAWDHYGSGYTRGFQIFVEEELIEPAKPQK